MTFIEFGEFRGYIQVGNQEGSYLLVNNSLVEWLLTSTTPTEFLLVNYN